MLDMEDIQEFTNPYMSFTHWLQAVLHMGNLNYFSIISRSLLNPYPQPSNFINHDLQHNHQPNYNDSNLKSILQISMTNDFTRKA